MFSKFAKWISRRAGSARTFMLAWLVIVLWALSGLIFDFTDRWQLSINTVTTIVTFLMVFVIQNTQNRETLAIQLKLDELLRAIKGAKDTLIDVEELSDKEMEELQKAYELLAHKAQKRTQYNHRDRRKSDRAK